MSAIDTAPSSSVNRGTDFEPPVLSTGSTAGIAGRLALTFRSPGEYRVSVLKADSAPAPAPNKGKLLITGDGDEQVLSLSDGVVWRSLKLGANL